MEEMKYFNDVVDITKKILAVEEVDRDTDFVKDLGATSLNLAQIMNALEDLYEIEVPFMKFKRCHTVGETAVFLAELLEE